MIQKECFKCHQVKPLTEFYKHPGTADGHLNKCKVCTKKDTSANATKNRDYYREYNRARSRTEKVRQQRKEALLRERAKNPKATLARRKVAEALKKGLLEKEPCYCGETKVEGHHPDYDQPLFVIWLCHKHHKHIHGRKAF